MPLKMSDKRSPIKGSYGSQPDLSKFLQSDAEDMQVTLRKRKQPPGTDCTCTKEISSFRKEVTSLFATFTETQKEFLNTLREDMTQIKTKIDTLQTTTENLVADNSVIKEDIAQLKQHTSLTEEKVKSLQNDVNNLKSRTGSEYQNMRSCDDEALIREINERTNRANNIIIYGLTELAEGSAEEKQDHDKNEVLSVIRSIMDNVPAPKKIIRLGKLNPTKNRPLKIYFDCSQIPKQLMKNKGKITNKDIKIYADLTPTQQNNLKLLRQDLCNRQENGETDITIKYVNGVPKIVAVPPKNSES